MSAQEPRTVVLMAIGLPLLALGGFALGAWLTLMAYAYPAYALGGVAWIGVYPALGLTLAIGALVGWRGRAAPLWALTGLGGLTLGAWTATAVIGEFLPLAGAFEDGLHPWI